MLLPVDMRREYSHISSKERDLIGVMLAKGESIRTIAKQLNRNPGSISRELKRNGIKKRKLNYLPHEAQEKASKRFSQSHFRIRLKNEEIKSYITGHLLEKWSPEIIAGRLSIDRPELKISHEAIYQWIYKEAREYIPYLTRKRHQRRSRTYSLKHGKMGIPGRVSIDERPPHINERKEVGHWEVDLIESWLKKGAIQIMTERKTRYTLLGKLKILTAPEARDLMIEQLSGMRRIMRKSFTYDNGSENKCHLRINNLFGTQSYFCHPYSGWEKGTVENTAGLVRRFFPKGTHFALVKDEEIENMQNWLNQRPRKCLNFKTPSEVFKSECCT